MSENKWEGLIVSVVIRRRMGKQAKHNFIEKEKEKRKQVYHSHAYLKKK